MKQLFLYTLGLLMALTASAQNGAANACAQTYWTANGSVLPLPLLSGERLQVPAEAVAVDLRGIGQINTVFSMDVSKANPNCLYYLETTDPQLEGLDEGRKVVRGLHAEAVMLSEDYDFLCPLAFQADFITFMMKPTGEDSYGEGYTETLVLPFQPDQVQFYDINGQADVLHADLFRVLCYAGNRADSLLLSLVDDIQQMQPYVPYMLGVYVNSRLLFQAEDALVPKSCEVAVLAGSYEFRGATVATRYDTPVYLYVPSANCFSLNDEGPVMAPFRACLMKAKEALPDGGDASSGVFDILNFSETVWGDDGWPGQADNPTHIVRPLVSAQSRGLFTLSGQRLGRYQCLRSGVYVMDGKKVMVK